MDPTLLFFLSDVSSDAQEKALQRFYTSVYHKEPRNFNPSSAEFYAREDKLNQYMNFFTHLLDSEGTSETVKELAIRLILLVANIRKSGEDYLVAYNYISSRNWKINLHAELSLNPYLKGIDIEEPESKPIVIEPEGDFEINFDDSRKFKMDNPTDHELNFATRCSFAFAEDYFYLFIRNNGIVKIGYRDTGGVSAGRVYDVKEVDYYCK